MQFVFGNPSKKGKSKKVKNKKSKTKGGSVVAKKKKGNKSKGRKKGGKKKGRKLIAGKKSGVTIRHSSKKGAPRLKITRVGTSANPKRRKKSKKNPLSSVYWKRPPTGAEGVNKQAQFRTVGRLLTSGDKGWVMQQITKIKSQVAENEKALPGYTNRTGISDKTLKRQISALKTKIKKMELVLKKGNISMAEAQKKITALQQDGYQILYSIDHGNYADSSASLTPRKSSGRGKGKGKGKGKGRPKKKTKAQKKAAAARRRKANKKKTKKNPVFTLGNPRRKKVASRKLRKGQSIRLMTNPKRGFKIKRTNPLGGFMGKLEEVLGHQTAEVAVLAIAGAAYGPLNKILATNRYTGGVHKTLSGIVPGLGASLPMIAIGAALNVLASRYGQAQAAALGKGLVAAAVVGAGAGLQTKFAPQLSAPAALSGVDYTMEGYGEGDDADFGLLPEGMGEGDDADFGGVDYTMEGDGQMGRPYDGVDYTMEGYGEGDDADFGSIPEGMGQGQMG